MTDTSLIYRADDAAWDTACFAACGAWSTEAVRQIAAAASDDYVLLLLRPVAVMPGHRATERMERAARETGAALVYADYTEDGAKHPTIDYQAGSLRDDFDFGPLVLVRTDLLREYAAAAADYRWAAWYDLRLMLSRRGAIFHLDETLYEVGKREEGIGKRV